MQNVRPYKESYSFIPKLFNPGKNVHFWAIISILIIILYWHLVWRWTIFNISMTGLHGKKVLQMKKYHFHKWLWVPFLKTKIIWQDLAQLWPKTEFQWCQIVLKSFQKCVILWSQICRICFSNIETVMWVPPLHWGKSV